MNDSYALRYLSKVMDWTFEEDNRETTWLRTMSDFKYDGYRDFWAGSRFPEALLNWLQQFDKSDRQFAYRLVRDNLIFVSFSEMQQLVHRTLSVHGRRIISERVAAKAGIPKYLIWAQVQSEKQYMETLQRTLFIGLSDGARIDGFRRANVGIVANDQVALGYELSPEKWEDLQESLRERTGDSNAQFEVLFLIDDFVGSGKTLLRKSGNEWKGKLTKLAKNFIDKRDMFSQDCTIAVHHYIGTQKAKETIVPLLKEAGEEGGAPSWFGSSVHASFDLLIREDKVFSRNSHPDVAAFLDRYYDPAIETKSIREGGEGAAFGFAGCGLPLILEHNTPNNSLAILWAESLSIGGTSQYHNMRPLFRRRQRHS